MDTPFNAATSRTLNLGRAGVELDELRSSARDEVFEDGVESNFSIRFLNLFDRNPEPVLEVITALIVNRKMDDESAAETLRILGRITHHPTHSARLWLLERSLNSHSATVRDGALLGIASMDDSSAAPYLRKALLKEHITGLREDLEQALDLLEHPDHATSP